MRRLKNLPDSPCSDFSELPNEFWISIFKRLNSLNDLLSCRAVNRVWRRLVESIEISPGLHIINEEIVQEPICFNGLYLFTNKAINLDYSIRMPTTKSTIRLLGAELMINKMLNIQRLSMSHVCIANEETLLGFELIVNGLRLVQLQIKHLSIRIHDEDGDLIVPKLSLSKSVKVFSVQRFDTNTALCLDAAIEKLGWYSSIHYLDLCDTRTVVWLAVDHFERDLIQFHNVQYLYFRFVYPFFL